MNFPLLLCSNPLGKGALAYKTSACVCPSVYLSVCHLAVACLDLTRERKRLGSPNLAGWKPVTRVTGEHIISRSKSQMSGSQGRLMLSEKVCHIFRTRKPTKLNLVNRWRLEYEDPHHYKHHDLQGQRSRLQDHVMRLAGVGGADKSRMKRNRNTKIGRKVANSTSNNAYHFQGQSSKVKVTRPGLLIKC